MKKKRTKQLIAILLAVTMITLAATKPYQEAKATGVGGIAAGAAAGFGALSPGGQLLILTGIIGVGCMFVTSQDFRDLNAEGKKHAIEKAGKQIKEDFYNHTVQALNNNVSAAEQQRDNAAHARSVIEDWLESAGGGVIDTTSEAWRWFQDFVSDIRAALKNESSQSMNGYVGGVLDGTYTDVAVLTPTEEAAEKGTKEQKISIEIKGMDVSDISSQCFLALKASGTVLKLCVARLLADGTMAEINTSNIGAELRFIASDGSVTGWRDYNKNRVLEWSLGSYIAAYGLPLLVDGTKYAAPSGTTDVPGVSNVNDYVAVGSDLPYNRPEGAWDICDPNGKQGQVPIGADIPGKLGYDDWYDLLGGVATGNTTWEEVANASDVITIGSDLANDYSPSNAKDWSAYHDGTIVGYDVDAAGNVTVTFEDGAVISIPQEYVSGMEWVNEQDKAQELDKDTALPVSGSLAYPLPAIQDPAVPADPQDPGGGSGDMKIDDDVKDYTLDFRKLFPFCIPFDIYKAVKLLDATPTAPVVHYKFYYTKSKSYTIDINLNKFNSVAAILRRMECLLFIIGLATATRRIYLRG